MEILTCKEVAKYLKLHVLTIQRMVNAGKIPHFKVGKTTRFTKESIDNWLEKGGKDGKEDKKT